MPDFTQLRALVSDTYTPNRPIQLESLFSGRSPYLRQIMDAVLQPGRHPVIFGDRGIGKTSLANVAAALAQHHYQFASVREQCNTVSTFSETMRSLLKRITLTEDALTAGFGSEPTKKVSSLAERLPPNVTIPDVVEIVRTLKDPKILLVVDEFDRAPKEVNLAFSDLIKALSDDGFRATILLVGVGDSLTTLIQNHPSIERNIEQVPLPQMSREEIEGIISQGEKNLGLVFQARIKTRIVELAQGFPYYAHMLCLQTALAALNDGTLEISLAHFRAGVRRSHESVDRSIREAYNNAITSSRETTFPDVLYAAARAHADEFGGVSPTDMTYVDAKRDGSRFNINSLNYPLSKLSSPDRGEILKRVGKERRYRYRFANPMMRQYVLMKEELERGDWSD
jgi:energy-coupling factor transporter ATP-binding protein EcfA2